ncbi:hypothetical protein [Pseudomonas gingeri]
MCDNFKLLKKNISDLDSPETLLPVVIKYWRFILIFTFAGTLLGGFYAFSRDSTYEASIYLRGPSYADVSMLNTIRELGEVGRHFDANKVFLAFARNIKSDSAGRNFYSQLVSSFAESSKKNMDYGYFLKNLSVTAVPFQYQGGIKSASNLGLNGFFVSYRASSSAAAVEGVERYIEVVKKITIDDLVRDYESDRSSIIAMYKARIDEARAVAEIQRLDTIAKLRISLRLARSVGLIGSGKLSLSADQTLVGDLTYLKGAHLIEEEIRLLDARKDNDFLIPELRVWQNKIKLYGSLNVDKEKISVFNRDGLIKVAAAPSNIERACTVVLGSIIGFMLSIVLLLSFVTTGWVSSGKND